MASAAQLLSVAEDGREKPRIAPLARPVLRSATPDKSHGITRSKHTSTVSGARPWPVHCCQLP